MIRSQQKSQWPGLSAEINPHRKRRAKQTENHLSFPLSFNVKCLFVQLNILMPRGLGSGFPGEGSRLGCASTGIPRRTCARAQLPGVPLAGPPVQAACSHLHGFRHSPVSSAHPDPTSPSLLLGGSSHLRHRAHCGELPPAAHWCIHTHTCTHTRIHTHTCTHAHAHTS